RSGNVMSFAIQDVVDPAGNSESFNDGTDTMSSFTSLTQDGTSVSGVDTDGATVKSGDHLFVLTHSFSRSSSWSGVATTSTTRYTFHSATVTEANQTGSLDWGCAPCSPLPLLYASTRIES